VAFAVAVRASETSNWCAVFADPRGGFAFFCFVPFFVEHFYDFCCVIVKKVIDVPEQTLFAF
jgi:hypothetical protein